MERFSFFSQRNEFIKKSTEASQKLRINQLHFYVPANEKCNVKNEVSFYENIFKWESIKFDMWYKHLQALILLQCIILKHIKYNERLTLGNKITNLNDYRTSNVYKVSILLMTKLAHAWTLTSIGK